MTIPSVEHMTITEFLEVFGTGCIGGIVASLVYVYAFWKKRQK